MNRLLALLTLLSFSPLSWSVDLGKSAVSSANTAIISAGSDVKTIGVTILLILTIIVGYKLMRNSL